MECLGRGTEETQVEYRGPRKAFLQDPTTPIGTFQQTGGCS